MATAPYGTVALVGAGEYLPMDTPHTMSLSLVSTEQRLWLVQEANDVCSAVEA